MNNTSVYIKARAKAFSCEGVKINRFLVDPNGDVSVWDEVAGYYTTCNCLSDSDKKRIVKLAREVN